MLPELDGFSLHHLTQHIRLADVLDVSLVALFFYAFITWLQHSTSRSTSRRIVVAVALFAGIYVLARVFNLFLIEMLLRVLLLVLLFAAVVLFQVDIRRLLDRIGRLDFFRRRTPPPRAASRTVDILTEAAAALAEQRTGALIAVRGRESWDGLIQGGIFLNGRVSKPLLYSIFNTDTPGHDGGVLIEGDCVTHFAAHLPLAASVPEVSRYGGTRHAAALGLAEQCDAFVIVVSEERGTIGVAHQGQLTQVESATDLRRRLGAYWQQHYEAPTDGQRMHLTRSRLLAALGSLGLATLLWALFAYSPDTVYRTFEAPIEYRNLPPAWELTDDTPSEARISLYGSEQAFRLLDPASLVVSVDLEDPQDGLNEVTLSDENLSLPSTIRLDRIEPQNLRLIAHRLRRAKAAIRVVTEGALPDSLQLVAAQAVPDTLTLLIPSRMHDAPAFVPTAAVDLARISASGTLKVPLNLPTGIRLPSGQSDEIDVTIFVQSRRNR